MSHALTIRDGFSDLYGHAGLFLPEPFVRSQTTLWTAFGVGVEIRMSRRMALLAETLMRDA